jgi:hypothetical protein
LSIGGCHAFVSWIPPFLPSCFESWEAVIWFPGAMGKSRISLVPDALKSVYPSKRWSATRQVCVLLNTQVISHNKLTSCHLAAASREVEATDRNKVNDFATCSDDNNKETFH